MHRLESAACVKGLSARIAKLKLGFRIACVKDPIIDDITTVQ